MLTLEQRGKAAVELWRNLTGDESAPAAALQSEMHAAARKADACRTPSPNFRKWLAGAPASGASGARAGFGSASQQRAHPGVGGARAATPDSSVGAPGVGSYNPQTIESQAGKGSSFGSRTPSVSRRRRSAEGSEGADAEGGSSSRLMPWDVREEERTPGMGHYHTSSRDMGKSLHREAGRCTPGMARPAQPSPRVQEVRAARAASPGPGRYDQGGFNLSRNERARPSAGFASKVVRKSPFGEGPLVANRGALEAMWK